MWRFTLHPNENMLIPLIAGVSCMLCHLLTGCRLHLPDSRPEGTAMPAMSSRFTKLVKRPRFALYSQVT
jgi:hypothetical protein